jgi:hypothetical protein
MQVSRVSTPPTAGSTPPRQGPGVWGVGKRIAKHGNYARRTLASKCQGRGGRPPYSRLDTPPDGDQGALVKELLSTATTQGELW